MVFVLVALTSSDTVDLIERFRKGVVCQSEGFQQGHTPRGREDQ